MTPKEIREAYKGSRDLEVEVLAEIAAQLAEANELTAKSQLMAQKQLEFLEKDFAFRSNPNQFVDEIKSALNGMLGIDAPTLVTPGAPGSSVAEAVDHVSTGAAPGDQNDGDFPKRRHH